MNRPRKRALSLAGTPKNVSRIREGRNRALQYSAYRARKYFDQPRLDVVAKAGTPNVRRDRRAVVASLSISCASVVGHPSPAARYMASTGLGQARRESERVAERILDCGLRDGAVTSVCHSHRSLVDLYVRELWQVPVQGIREPELALLVGSRGAGDRYVVTRRNNGRSDRLTVLFRLYSMTKPVASVALLTLYEQGLFRLTDPLDRYLPQFADVKVYKGTTRTASRYEAPARKPTIQEPSATRSGLVSGLGQSPSTPCIARRGSDGPARLAGEEIDKLANGTAALRARRTLGVRPWPRRAGAADRACSRACRTPTTARPFSAPRHARHVVRRAAEAQGARPDVYSPRPDGKLAPTLPTLRAVHRPISRR